MKPWFLIFFALLFLAGAQTSYAAFPVKDAAHDTRNADFKELVNSTIDNITGKNSVVNPALPLQSEEAAESGRQGILSFVFGVVGILAMAAGFAFPLVSGLIALGILFGILAIVLGARAFGKRNHSLAKAGFILGIVNLGLLALLLLIAIVGSAVIYG